MPVNFHSTRRVATGLQRITNLRDEYKEIGIQKKQTLRKLLVGATVAAGALLFAGGPVSSWLEDKTYMMPVPLLVLWGLFSMTPLLVPLAYKVHSSISLGRLESELEEAEIDAESASLDEMGLPLDQAAWFEESWS
ncbi:MAG: hypothetical protein HQ564_09725 [Candidatus Saganbacteria bacterium]|nr:hypothetical protein [Candidatus Saganbacteria bacterium]